MNKRRFSIDLLIKKYIEDPDNAIENAVGKTECFMFEDEISQNIITMWDNNDTDNAYELLRQQYVLRISNKIS